MWLPIAALAAMLLQASSPATEGMKALEEQRWDAAAAAFAKAAEADPQDYSHHFHLALALSMLNRDAEAIAEYEKVLVLKPGVPQAELNLGILLLRQKRAADALPHLQKALESKPGDAKVLSWTGEALLALDKANDAAELFKRALTADANSAAAEFGIGRALARAGNTSEAAVHLERAATLDAGYRDGLLELAQAYEKQKKYPEAVAIYRKFPDNAAAKERMGELLLESGQAADAIPQLEEAVAKSPTAANRYALASAYVLAKQLDKAAQMLEQAIASEPGNPELHMTYGRVLREQKKYPAAAAEFYKATQLKPDMAQAWSDLAGVLILNNDDARALAALDKVRALNAETAAHFYFRALVLDRNKQLKPALESYERFLAASGGKNPDEEWKARQRVRVLEKELNKR